MDRAQLAAVALILVVAAGAGVWFGGRPESPPPFEIERTVTTNGSGLTVHVAGRVNQPGLVRVGEGARVADVIAAAGGATSEAELSGLNLAASVVDGQQVVVPGRGEVEAGGSPPDGRVRINTATVAELQELPGVGPVLANQIAAYREEHGPFGDIEDLLEVPGIGEGKLATLRDRAVVP